MRLTHSCLPVYVAHQVVAFSMYIQDGYSPLHNASQEGHDGIVEKLLQAGATMNLQMKVGIDVTPSFGPKKSLKGDHTPSHFPETAWPQTS